MSSSILTGSFDEFEKFLYVDGCYTAAPSDESAGSVIIGGDAAVVQDDVVDGHPISATALCPLRHGTVYARPYPGYAHGNPKKGICPHGCRPETDCDITERETVKETLVREAMEFIELYYQEREDDMRGSERFVTKEDRMGAVLESIEETGTYEHTPDEIQHGSRLSWRNAPKCPNRKYWQNLKLIDCRDALTNQDMFESCLNHLSKAMACGSSEAYISVFKPAMPGSVDGPRIWNEQLLGYAAYEDGHDVLGDPKNLRFTQMLEERFGWTGPPDGKRGAHDYLPLVIQADPKGDPELFELPLGCAQPVHIFHPKYPELSQLEMEWYPIPAVCALDMTLGGILYTAIPFNGWYADTEVLRDLVDESRYNLIVPIAKVLGMDTDLMPGEPPYYKEDVLSILCKAIYHSFKTSKVAMIDHHNLIDMFWDWYRDEMVSRRYCPVNWKWVIPPVSASTNSAYLGLNQAQEYTLKPAYIVGKGFVQLENEAFGKRDLESPFANLFVCMIFGMKVRRWVKEIRARKDKVHIVYASVTGNAAKYAADLGSILKSCYSVTYSDACGVHAISDQNVMSDIQAAKLTVFVTSTQGNGEIPSTSEKFFSRLFSSGALKGKEVAVLGFGSSSYPIFCGGAAFISRMLAESGATELIPLGKCDAVKGEHQTFKKWTLALVNKIASRPDASSSVLNLCQNIQDGGDAILRRTRAIVDLLDVQVFSQAAVGASITKIVVKNSSSLRGSINSMNVGGLRGSINGGGLRGSINGGGLRGSINGGGSQGRPSMTKLESLSQIILGGSHHNSEDVGNNAFVGIINSQTELINKSGCDSDEKERGTSLIKIGILSSGNPPYEPGDHVRIYPHNNFSQKRLEKFVAHLSRNLTLDDQIYVTLEREDIKSTLAVHLPLLASKLGSLVPLRGIFEKELALDSPVSMEACVDLALIATGEEKTELKELGNNEDKYDFMVRDCGLKWIDLFDHFPSLSKKVSIEFLLCSMKKNHPRSYSIASCKSAVGPEMHLVVGRFLYSLGSGDRKKVEVGLCSNYLTSALPEQEVTFELESKRSFHLPSDPSSAIFFVCTGTGYAPMRGLLQKRAHLKRRGTKLGPACLIFGSRSSKEGLFQDEIREFHEEGILSGVFLCYSREPGLKREYTTDKLRSPEVKTVLGLFLQNANTHIFICGSALMAEQAKSAIREVSTQGDFDVMVQDGRIHCDVFGALAVK